MSLFKKIFGKKVKEESAENTTDNIEHKPEWDFYLSNVDDIIGSFYIDLGLFSVAPIHGKHNLIWISLKMNNPKDNGLSSKEEFDKLLEIEDRLKEFILSNHQSVYAGRLTSNNHRDFYFYFEDTTLYERSIAEAMVAYPSYTYEYGAKEDREWKLYTGFMYPNPRQYQSIQNRRVIENLESNGDPLTKQRAVDHWVYFKTETDRSLFLSKIQDLGFSIINKDRETSLGSFPYSLRISRVDYVDHDSVDDYVLKLWELAQECNGDYDGWETTVEKSG